MAELSELPGAPEEGRNTLQQLRRLLAQRCSETALTLTPALQRQPFCPRCGLSMDKTVEVEASAITTIVHNALLTLKRWFCAPEQQERLQRFAQTLSPTERSLLAHVLKLSPEDEAGWQFLTEALPLLQKALSPTAVAEADLGELCEMLEGRYLTCDEATNLFRSWLESKLPAREARLRFVWRKGQGS